MKYIKTFEKRYKQEEDFEIPDGTKLLCVRSDYHMFNSRDVKGGEIYEIERITWSRRKGKFVCKLKGVGADDEYSYFSENNFISELEHDMKNYNL